MKPEIYALNVVSILNEQFYAQNEHLEGRREVVCPYEFHSNGYSWSILFAGINVWDSENYSLYDSNDNEIDLEEFVRAEAKKVVKQFKNAKL